MSSRVRDDSSLKGYLKGYRFCTIAVPSVVHPGAIAALAATYPLTIHGWCPRSGGALEVWSLDHGNVSWYYDTR